jgi:CRP-like cAMP-binding protein
MSVISLVLAHVPLFSGLSAEELETPGRSLRPRRYARGDVIFQQGDPGDAFYIIESGEVKVVLSSQDGREAILTLLGAGHFFGELSLLDGGIVLGIRLTQEDLASMVGSTRETVNKWLKTWERQGLLLHRGGILTVLQPRDLRKRTHLIGEVGIESEAS